MDRHWGYLMRYCSLEEREAVLQNLIKSQGGASVFVWNSVMLGQKCASDREKVLERMKKAGVQPNDMTCSALIQGYSSGAEKEMALERMVAAGVQPNATTWTTVMGGYASFVDRARVFQRMTAAPHAVAVTRESIRSLFGSVEIFVDASHHLQSALDVARGLPDDLLCNHQILGKLLPMCAEANDPQLLRRLWGIGAAGLVNP